MGDLTIPDATSVGITRLGRDAGETVAELGPLASLVGTWIGSHGFELIAVPAMSNGKEIFRLIVRPYIEVIEFEAIGAPVPDRGGPAGDIFITGLLYKIRITDLQTNEPLHLENGMWLNLGKGQDRPIVRQASIPHGDVLLALGNTSNTDGAPTIPTPSALPFPIEGAPFGYAESWRGPIDNCFHDAFEPAKPNTILQAAIADQTITQTTELSVSTANGGALASIPFVDRNAITKDFSCTYWVETIKDKVTGNEIQQLQYSQQVNIDFIKQFQDPTKGLITWPHVNVNTLLKQ